MRIVKSAESVAAPLAEIFMKSKTLVCAGLAAALTMSVAFSSGCATRNEEDMKQIVATVDITKSDNLQAEGLSDYAAAISSQKDITKMELMASFYNVGYSYVQSGSSYAEVFEMLVDALTGTAVLTQYATLSLIRDKSAGNSSYLQEYLAKSTEVERYEFLLDGETALNDDGTEGYDRVLAARYSLYSGINSSLDSLEQSIIDEEEDSSSSSDTRTIPGGADEEREDYLPLDKNNKNKLDYNIFTGYEGYLIDDSGAYEDDQLEGSTRATRRKAYASFITNLRDNFLIGEEEDVRDVLSISYIQEEYLSQLQQQVINEYYERYQAAQEELIEKVDGDGVYTFLQSRYESDLADQTNSYSQFSAFESAMSSVSDTSFLLYAPATEGTDGGSYGFVYNILLPFNAAQNVNIDTSDTSAQYYFARKALLEDITATDQRSVWFNGATDYSFDASADGINIDYYGKDAGRDYLFFEDNLLHGDRYSKLEKYDGRYSYNGTVVKNGDEKSYSLSPAKLTIDDMLAEFEAYVEYVMGGGTVEIAKQDSYNVDDYTQYYTDETKDLPDSQKKIDYSKFVYAKGKVDLGYDFTQQTQLSSFLANMFVSEGENSAAYKAMSAVNELQFAYTTDTSVLSQYIGYSVSAFTTSYVPEFEYAAQQAVNEGPGTVYVCAADYGWHIIYVTATYPVGSADGEGGAVYGDLEWTAEYVLKEGTFQNLYYNWIKDSTLSSVTTNRRAVINELFGGDATVTRHEDAYRDLLELDSQSA